MKGRKATSAAGAAASTVVKCAALAIILASATPEKATLHLTTCSTCATQATQGGGR